MNSIQNVVTTTLKNKEKNLSATPFHSSTENLYIVRDLKVSPGLNMVFGNPGLLGESG
jgi:hypothetical protein